MHPQGFHYIVFKPTMSPTTQVTPEYQSCEWLIGISNGITHDGSFSQQAAVSIGL